MHNRVSVVISAFNEEQNIKDCLESVRWADEIIVINNSSTDKTELIAQKYTSSIICQENNPQRIDLQKNIGFEKAKNLWILSLDADERVPKELADEIISVTSAPSEEVAFEIPRKNIIFGKWIEHSLWWPDYQLRLFQKGKGKFTKATVHKSISVDGRVGKLSEPMLHKSYTSITQYVQKMDSIYAENEASMLVREGKKLRSLDALSMPAHDFLKTFFLQQGYKDGLHGLVLSLLQAFYAFLVFTKVWERQGFKEVASTNFLDDVWGEMKKLTKEFNYWYLTRSINDSTDIVKKTYLRLKRKRHAA
jgi:glycosyltransferase involved in cell wall biosynthesis